MEKMKILVIGASGLLAGPVIRKLDEKGYDLRLFSRSVKPSMFVNDYDIAQGDVFNPADLEKAVSGCDAVHISLASADDVKAVEHYRGVEEERSQADQPGLGMHRGGGEPVV
jgi:uncharacterized protein YbjT (DUF2867 family)